MTPQTLNHPKVDEAIGKAKKWQSEFKALRALAQGSGLVEDFKWGQPCYTLDNANVVLIHGFKDYCALLFFKGALLDDKHQLLVQQTEKVQSARQLRFTSLQQINDQAAKISDYISAAMAVEKAGLKVELKKTEAFEVAEEFQRQLDADTNLKEAFEALTPGRQRAYLLYFAGAKQAKTRAARVEKYIPRILDGLGMDD